MSSHAPLTVLPDEVVNLVIDRLDNKSRVRFSGTSRRIRRLVIAKQLQETGATILPGSLGASSFIAFTRLFPPDLAPPESTIPATTTSKDSKKKVKKESSDTKAQRNEQLGGRYGLRLVTQRALLAELEEKLLKRRNIETLQAGASRFEQSLAACHPDTFDLDEQSSMGSQLRIKEARISRSWPNFYCEASSASGLAYGSIYAWNVYERSKGPLRKLLKEIFEPDDPAAWTVSDACFFELQDLETLKSMEETSSSETVVYVWIWIDPLHGTVWFYVGSTTDAPARWKSHQKGGVNHFVRGLEELDRFSWDDVKSYALYKQERAAPAAFIYPAETIVNVLTGATLGHDVAQPTETRLVQGLNVNVLDWAMMASAISAGDFENLYSRALKFFASPDATPKIPYAYHARFNPLPYLDLLAALTDDPDMTLVSLANILRGAVAGHLMRAAHARQPLPTWAFQGDRVPSKLQPETERLEDDEHKLATRALQANMPVVDPKPIRTKPPRQAVNENRAREADEAAYAADHPEAQAVHAAATRRRAATISKRADYNAAQKD